MIDFSHRSHQKELLDRNDIPFGDIVRNMRELNFINKWLGGHSITLKGFKKIAGKKNNISVCEVGCGGGDNLDAIYKFCNKKKLDVKFIGIDINPKCIAFARRNAAIENINFFVSDYRQVEFKDPMPDVIFCSLNYRKMSVGALGCREHIVVKYNI